MDKVELIFVEPHVPDQVSYICFIYLILRTDIIIAPISQMRKLRLRQLEQLAQRGTSSEWW